MTEITAKEMYKRVPNNPIANIIVTHSWRNTMHEVVCEDIANHFFSKGYAVMQVNLPGHTEGTHLRDLSFESAKRRIYLAKVLLANETGPKKTFGVGISMGSAAIALASENFDAMGLLSYAPLVNPSVLYERYADEIEYQLANMPGRDFVVMDSTSGRGAFEMGLEWIQEMRDDPMKIQRDVLSSNVPALLIQGTDDPFYDRVKYDAFAKSCASSSCILDGADHNFTSQKDRKNVILFLENFFSKY